MAAMFTQLSRDGSRKQRRLVFASVLLHAAILGWALHPPEPQLLTPSSIAFGHNGTAVTPLYFPSRATDDSSASSPDSATQKYRHQRLAHQRLVWKQNPQMATLSPVLPADGADKSKTSTVSALGHGAAAGLPYGTLNQGAAHGDEIQPALPVRTADPFAYPWELPEAEGNVVVEITIDERGEIVNRQVLQSMGANLDTKVLAALEKWQFRPATHNGIAIASKQDAIFHFKARG